MSSYSNKIHDRHFEYEEDGPFDIFDEQYKTLRIAIEQESQS